MSSLSVQAALACLIARRKKASYPKGEYNPVGVWLPTKEEWQPCCFAVNPPTYRYPLAMRAHCCTLKHVAYLFGVQRAELARALRVWLADQKVIRKGSIS